LVADTEGDTVSVFLDVKNLQLGYRKSEGIFRAPLSFSVPNGKLTALIGKNGEGKSTLLQALLGADVVTNGIAQVLGIATNREAWRRIAYVPQDHPFQTALLVEDFLALAFLPELGLFGRRAPHHQERIDSKLALLSLVEFRTRRMGEISAGERQRVFLARALLQKSEALFLDEPTNHLDPASREIFWQAINTERHHRNLDVLVISHDLDFLETHSEWIISLKNHTLLFNGPTTEARKESILRKTYW